MEQGSKEWLEYRKKKIGASDASTILGINPWKTPMQLWEEKCDLRESESLNEAMLRGIELEPFARELFIRMTGISVNPVVLENQEHDWMIASLDGMCEDKKHIVEIKCGGNKLHEMARNGIIPDYYRCQMQHQMAVAQLEKSFYFSFDGNEGLLLGIERDDKFIKNMIEKEKEFYRCMMEFEMPPSKYVEKKDFEWTIHTDKLKDIKAQKKILEEEESKVRSKIISLCDEKNCQGNGVTVSKAIRKGSIDYETILSQVDIDAEKYRKPNSTYWRIS